MKRLKTAYIGILLIFLMFGSTFAYAVIQSVNIPNQNQNEQTLQIPTGVIDYELSANQQVELLRAGYTIMDYRYNFACEQCIKERSLLSQIVQSREFQNQIVLQEILSENAGNLTIKSVFGEETLTNFDSTDVTSSLCRIVASPPPECVVFQITTSNETTNSTQ